MHAKLRIYLSALLMITAGGLSACNSDSDDNPNTGGTGGEAQATAAAEAESFNAAQSAGVEASRPLTDLSAAEAQQICEAFRTSMGNITGTPEAQTAQCNLAGALTAAFAFGGDEDGPDLVELCTMAVDECVEKFEVQEAELDDCVDTHAKLNSEECTATVAEVNACAKDAFIGVGQAMEALAAFDCASVVQEQNESPLGSDEEPESCQTLQQKCPGLTLLDPDGEGSNASEF